MGLKCTYCGGGDFFEGPSGGVSTNVLCANRACRHWFNETLGELADLHRVEPTEEERAAVSKDREGKMNLGLPRMLVKIEDIYQEGVQAYRDGRSSRSCMEEKPYSGYGAAQSNMIRICGWMDAAMGRLP